MSFKKLLSAAAVLAAVILPTFSAAKPASAATSCSMGTATLKVGSSGTAVNCLETRLGALKLMSSYIDSYFGTVTTTAVKTFQTSRGLVADGIVGTQTKNALYAAATPTPVLPPTQSVPSTTQSLMSPPTSPNQGTWCAASNSAADLNAFFSQPHGSFYGADYQRAYKLPDGRVLWMFQDAFLSTSSGAKKFVHNVGMIQSGKCFSLLRAGSSSAPASWLLWDKTVDMKNWYWALGGVVSNDGTTLQLFMAEMKEPTGAYLSNSAPSATYIVSIRLSDLRVTGYQLAPAQSQNLYGWSVTSDAQYTYLYGHCYRQFGFSNLGHDACTQYMYLARVPKGAVTSTPEYWTAAGWSTNAAAASPIVDFFLAGKGINPGQVMFDGSKFIFVEKEGDWWGSEIIVGSSTTPQGPFTVTQRFTVAPKNSSSSTYFASIVPWTNPDGSLIIGLSHNAWSGALTSAYRPSFFVAWRP